MVWFILKDFCKPKVQPNLRKCQLKARSKQLLQPVVNVSSSYFWINPFLSNVPFCSQLWLSDIFTTIKIESLGRNELVTASSDLTDLSLASNDHVTGHITSREKFRKYFEWKRGFIWLGHILKFWIRKYSNF